MLNFNRIRALLNRRLTFTALAMSICCLAEAVEITLNLLEFLQMVISMVHTVNAIY